MKEKEFKKIKYMLLDEQFVLDVLDFYLMDFGFKTCFISDVDKIFQKQFCIWKLFDEDDKLIGCLKINFLEQDKRVYEEKLNTIHKQYLSDIKHLNVSKTKYVNTEQGIFETSEYSRQLTKWYYEERNYILSERVSKSQLLIKSIEWYI